VKRKRVFGLALMFLVLSATAVYFYYAAAGFDRASGQGEDAQDIEIEQAVARIGDLTVSVSGAGQLAPAATAMLSFPEDGQLVEMRVNAGDAVKAGDILARLQTDKTPTEHAAEIASAQLAVLQAELALQDLSASAQIEAAQALATLEEAQQALDEANDNQPEQALAQQAVSLANEAVEEAEMQIYILSSTPSAEAMDIAYASLLFKEKELAELQDQIDKLEYQIKAAPNSEVRERLKLELLNMQAKLAQQQIEVENARYKYETLDDPPEPLELATTQAQLSSAQAQLAEAQRELEKAMAGASASELAMAEAALAEAQAAWERLKDGPDPDEVALAEAQLAQAQAKLALLRQEQLILDLVAPMDGIVSSIQAAPGDRITGQTILTLVDPSQPRVEVYLDEADLPNVQAGYQAEVVFEALPDETFSGQIMEVDPSLNQFGETAALRAWIQLDAMSADKAQKLPLGLNATVDIIAGQTSDAVLVPVEAIHETSPGEYSVYVIQGKDVELRQVSIGLMDFTSAEVRSGLAAGETVALGDIESFEGTP
jgi:RND family efflux transporter MFP subunit